MALALFVVVLALVLFHGGAVPARRRPDFSYYHHMDALLQEVKDVVAGQPESMKAEEIRAAEDEYSASILVITVEPGGFTQQQNQKVRVLLNFGQHAREIITCEVALRFLKMLADKAIRYSLLRDAGEEMERIMLNSIIKIIPMENYNGRKLFEEKNNLCERQNGRGVDTNRNWAFDWGVKEKDYDAKEEYPGERPFSEPEAQIILSIAQGFHPHVWVNVHSGMEALFMPYDHTGRIPRGKSADIQLEMLKILNREACHGECKIGSGGRTVGYLAHGTATDFMYEVLHVPLSFTFEIYGDEDAPYMECFRMFNPINREGYEEVIGQWVFTLFKLMELLPLHPSIPGFIEAAQQSKDANPVRDLDRDPANGNTAALADSVLSSIPVQFKGSQATSSGLRTVPAHHAGIREYQMQRLLLLVFFVFITAVLGCWVMKRRSKSQISSMGAEHSGLDSL